MQSVTSAEAAILQTAIRAPRLYVWAKLPVIVNNHGNIDAAKLGSQLVLSNITSCRLTNVLEIGSDTVDFELTGNVNNDWTPLNNTSKWGRFFAVGAVDIKYQIFLGIAKDGTEGYWSKGVYVSESINQDVKEGLTKFQVNALDQFSLFRGEAYTSFPPRLYGAQNNGYFNPNYNLINTQADLKNYLCDAQYWMQNSSDFDVWSSDWVAVAVYSSALSSGATPVPNSGSTAYTINYPQGKVTFTTAQGATDTISVDARPLAMRPELALYHLFVDYGGFDPAFIKFDQSGMMLPLLELSRERSLVDTAKDIVSLTAPRGVRWSLWFDESGYLRFSENNPDGPAVKTFYDTRDIISFTPEYSVKEMANVVRANAVLSSDQPIVSDSYDLYSISTYTEKPIFSVPDQFLSVTKTMDLGSAMSYLNGLTSSILFEYCRPSLQCDIEILPQPQLQVGDPINVIETKTGVNNRFIIKQINNELQEEEWKQTLRIEKQNFSQDWNFGLAANLGTNLGSNTDAIQTQNGFITDVGFSTHGAAETHVVQNGQPVTDAAFQPLVYNWDGSPLTVYTTLDNIPASSTAYIWRWMYVAEDVYCINGIVTANGSMLPVAPPSGWAPVLVNLTGTGTVPTLPYDVRNNVDSSCSRRYWWPLLRPSDWTTNDGVTGYTTTTNFTSTWSLGPGSTGSWQAYGNLLVGKNDFFGDTTSGFVGQKLWDAGMKSASVMGGSSTTKYGVDFGLTFNSQVWYGIKNKQTPCYLNILVATTAGTMTFKKIAFMLSI